ncbi:unnamed protein product [Pedinophyceae sp. YPF-701]|nr:unnamed protein product [Pedinophyceae sp. YPF-701]
MDLQGLLALLQDNQAAVVTAALAVLLLVTLLGLGGGKKHLPPALDPSEWILLPLVEKRSLNHNTLFMRFGLSDPKQPLGLPIGQHILLRAVDQAGAPIRDDKGLIARSYTPTSPQGVTGHVDFVIKVYPQGRMTQHLDKMKEGEVLQFKGPKGEFEYEPNMCREIGMVAGGTGITPMYQVLQAALADKRDRTKFSLIFGNITEQDILLRDELEAMAREHATRFKLHLVLDRPPEGWKGGSGYVTAEMAKAHLPKPAGDVKVLRCGPPGMMAALKGVFEEVGYSPDSQFQF